MAMGVHSDMEALTSQSDRWRLGGEQVPVVSQYRYLGTMIYHDLEFKHITSDRLLKGKRALASLSRFFSSKLIPIEMRILSLKTLNYYQYLHTRGRFGAWLVDVGWISFKRF